MKHTRVKRTHVHRVLSYEPGKPIPHLHIFQSKETARKWAAHERNKGYRTEFTTVPFWSKASRLKGYDREVRRMMLSQVRRSR